MNLLHTLADDFQTLKPNGFKIYYAKKLLGTYKSWTITTCHAKQISSGYAEMLRLNLGLAESCSRSTVGFTKCGPGTVGDNKVCTGEGQKITVRGWSQNLRSKKGLEWLGKFCYRWR